MTDTTELADPTQPPAPIPFAGRPPSSSNHHGVDAQISDVAADPTGHQLFDTQWVSAGGVDSDTTELADPTLHATPTLRSGRPSSSSNHHGVDAQTSCVAADPTGQRHPDSHPSIAGGVDSDTTELADPMFIATPSFRPGRPSSSSNQKAVDAQQKHVAADPTGHRLFDTQWVSAGGVDSCPSHRESDTQATLAGAFPDRPDQTNNVHQTRRVRPVGSPHPVDQTSLDDQLLTVDWVGPNAELVIYAKALDELMAPRIATGQRLYQLGQYGLDNTKAYARMAGLQDGIHALEKEAVKALEDAMRRHPLGPWVMSQKGVGLKTAGRLLAILGNPADRPNPAKLWAYCGWHVINGAAPRRAKGEQANWNTQAKTLSYLVAEACIKNRDSAYRHVYDETRTKYADAVHTHPCPQCGICDGCGKPPGKNKATHLEDTGCDARKVRHAEPGDPLKDGHKHARAMRAVAKAFLLDLWREARRITRPESPAQ